VRGGYGGQLLQEDPHGQQTQMRAAAESSPLSSAGSGRRAFIAAFAIALAIYIAAARAIPDGWWQVAFAIPWALASVMVLDHLHGSGEFSRLGSFARLLAMVICIGGAAGQVENRFDGLAGWLAFVLTFAGLVLAVELLGRALRPRYRGRGIFG
jgi:hypothetical protein